MDFDIKSFFDLYLPVAELNINFMTLVAIGMSVGFLAGLCGIGGSIVLLPILSALNIPINVAVITALNQVIATSCTNALAAAKNKLIDYKLGLLLLIGSFVGITAGMSLYYFLLSIGKLDIFLPLAFLIAITLIGTFSAKQAALLLYHRYKKSQAPNHTAPSLIRNCAFYKIKLISFQSEISVIFPILLGTLSGAMVSFMGFGGAIVMAPVLIYFFGISPKYTNGTVGFQMIFTALISYFIHAMSFRSIDLVLSTAILIGSTIGAQIGYKIGAKLSQETFKTLLAIVILILCTKLGIDLFSEPKEIYQIEVVR